MNKKPYFSIILPTYNQSEFLKNSINSILKQTYNNWELIIIDNKSTDDTLSVIKKYKDERINILSINNCGILAKSRNFGIKKAQSEWICFIDSDDIWYPKKLEITKKFITKTKAELFYHDLVFENKKFLFIKKKIKDKSRTMSSPIIKYFAENGNGIGQSSVVIKKKLLEKLDFFSEKKDKYSWEDFDFWIRASLKTEKFVRIPIVLGSITVGDRNISSLDRQIINSHNIKKNYQKLFNKFIDNKNKYKELWWLEYPLILKDYKEKDLISLKKKISHISKAPLKFNLIFFYMKKKLFLYGLVKKIIKIFTFIVFFKNKKKIKKVSLSLKKYIKVNNRKRLKKLKFKNFEIPKEFFQRINDKNELHCLYKNKELLTYGWSSKNKFFLIDEINCEIKNNSSIIFYDFFTIKEFRNHGFYKILLKKMLNIFNYKNCYIYSTLFNLKSLRAIKNSNFEKTNIFSIFKKKINLANE